MDNLSAMILLCSSFLSKYMLLRTSGVMGLCDSSMAEVVLMLSVRDTSLALLLLCCLVSLISMMVLAFLRVSSIFRSALSSSS